MTIYFPESSQLQGKLLWATVLNRLSFLHCNFIMPTKINHVSLPAIDTSSLHFSKIMVTPALWHRHLGHPAWDTTKTVLTKDCATGIEFKGSFLDEHCISCIIGKQPACPFNNLHHHASKICELLYMDLCGPFPTQFANRKTMYFHSILNNHSNYGSTALLSKKDQAYKHYKDFQACLKLKSNNKVMNV